MLLTYHFFIFVFIYLILKIFNHFAPCSNLLFLLYVGFAF